MALYDLDDSRYLNRILHYETWRVNVLLLFFEKHFLQIDIKIAPSQTWYAQSVSDASSQNVDKFYEQ